MKQDTYQWLDKDPIIDVIRTAWERAGRPSFVKMEDLCNGHPKASTIAGWIYGRTRFPQNWSTGRVLDVLEVDTTARWRDSGQPVYVDPDFIRALVRERLRKAA